MTKYEGSMSFRDCEAKGEEDCFHASEGTFTDNDT